MVLSIGYLVVFRVSHRRLSKPLRNLKRRFPLMEILQFFHIPGENPSGQFLLYNCQDGVAFGPMGQSRCCPCVLLIRQQYCS